MLKKILPHACIVVSVVLLALLIIDQVNSAMGFINNPLTKILLFIFVILVSATAVAYISDQRR